MNPQIVYTDGKELFITEPLEPEILMERLQEITMDRFKLVCILF